jgi:carbon monoxide dehydrogenase subunit G
MKVQEEFVVQEDSGTLWEFFEQVDRVARCVPGVEEVTVVDADNSRVRVTQAVGPMTATFDMKMRITARDPGRSMEFTAIGRSVRGAAGNVRATNTVFLEDGEDGSTRVLLEGDVALGGMLGSVGQKVVAKQASKVTRSFAQALQQELSGRGGEPEAVEPAAAEAAGARPADEPAPAPAADMPAPAVEPPPAPAPDTSAPASPAPRSLPAGAVPAGALALALALAALVLRRLRSR